MSQLNLSNYYNALYQAESLVPNAPYALLYNVFNGYWNPSRPTNSIINTAKDPRLSNYLDSYALAQFQAQSGKVYLSNTLPPTTGSPSTQKADGYYSRSNRSSTQYSPRRNRGYTQDYYY